MTKSDPSKSRRPKSKASEEASTQKVRIKVKSYDHSILDRSAKQIVETAERTGAAVSGPVPLPTSRSVFTVNRASFVNNKSKEQFEMRIHKRLIDIVEVNPKTIDSLMSLNLPAGVDIEIQM